MAVQAKASEKSCRFQNKGYCKYEEKCCFRHPQIVCQDGQQCSQKQCFKRHPTPCKFYFLKKNCKFKEKCMFSHNDLNEKEELKQLKEEIEAIKQNWRITLQTMNRKIKNCRIQTKN